MLVAAAFAIIILASVIPIIRGADLNISGAGPFTQRAEVRLPHCKPCAPLQLLQQGVLNAQSCLSVPLSLFMRTTLWGSTGVERPSGDGGLRNTHRCGDVQGRPRPGSLNWLCSVDLC